MGLGEGFISSVVTRDTLNAKENVPEASRALISRAIVLGDDNMACGWLVWTESIGHVVEVLIVLLATCFFLCPWDRRV